MEPLPESESALPTSPAVKVAPAARLALDAAEFPTLRRAQYEDARRDGGEPARRDEVDDGLAYLTDGFYGRGGRTSLRSGDAADGKGEGSLAKLWHKWFGKDDRGRGPGERFGESVDDALGGGGVGERKRFASDPAFCDWVSPLSNPFYFEDPRSLTELRPLVFYQRIPDSDGFFRGGNAFFIGGQARLAFTERVSLVVNKVGLARINPGAGSIYERGGSLSEFWIGPKVVVYRDAESKTLLTLGGTFQIPVGSDDAFQDTGRFSFVPYVTAGQRLLGTEIGTLNGLASAGYSFGDRDRSQFFFASAHLDFDIANGHRFYPVAELNWFSYTSDGRARPVGTEGRDFANLGGAAKGHNLVTWALGLRWKSQSKRFEVGGGYEGFAFGNRGLFDGRFTVDFIWRY